MSGYLSDRPIPIVTGAERLKAEEFIAEVARILNGKTKVVHCKKEEYDTYIARPSKWGNPFKIGIDGDRKEVIEKYRNWLMEQPELLAALPEIKGKILGCWCKPEECHGDVLAEMADMM